MAYLFSCVPWGELWLQIFLLFPYFWGYNQHVCFVPLWGASIYFNIQIFLSFIIITFKLLLQCGEGMPKWGDLRLLLSNYYLHCGEDKGVHFLKLFEPQFYFFRNGFFLLKFLFIWVHLRVQLRANTSTHVGKIHWWFHFSVASGDVE